MHCLQISGVPLYETFKHSTELSSYSISYQGKTLYWTIFVQYISPRETMPFFQESLNNIKSRQISFLAKFVTVEARVEINVPQLAPLGDWDCCHYEGRTNRVKVDFVPFSHWVLDWWHHRLNNSQAHVLACWCFALYLFNLIFLQPSKRMLTYEG